MLALGVARLGVGLPLMRDHLEAAQPSRPLSLKRVLDAIARRQPIDWQWTKMRDTAALLNPVEKSQIFFLKLPLSRASNLLKQCPIGLVKE